MRETVIFDVDGVLAVDHSRMQKTLDTYFQCEKHWKTWNHYRLFDHYNATYEECLNALKSDISLFDEMEFVPYAASVLNALAVDFNVVILTHRGFHPNGLSSTEKKLKENGIDYEEIFAIPPMQCKVEFLKKYFGKVLALIEDNTEIIKQAQKLSCVDYPFLVNQPWNKNDHTTAKRVDNIKDVELILTGKG